jgi:endothelin-converting enzyme
MGEAVGEEYVRRHFSPSAKRQIEELVDNLTKAYRIRIQSLDWMEPATKKSALEKLDAVKRKLAYPEIWRDYSSMKIDGESYFGNCINASEFEFKRRMGKLGKPVDRAEWHMYPQTVNAYYNHNMTEIVFPAAIMQPPFFDPEADDALNYAGIGAVIGHELTHGFDDQGSKFDAQGNMRNWWTETDRKNFESKTEKVVEQFNTYKPLDDISINGKLTLGENIADLGGLSIAYDAFRITLKEQGKEMEIGDLTPDERFFTNWAQIWRVNMSEEALRLRLNTDPHSPGKYRANATISNMPEFYKTFGCETGDKMYREEKDRIKIW